MSEELIRRAKEIMTDARLKHKWGDSLTGKGNTGGDNVITGCIRGPDSVVKTYPCHRPINSFSKADALWSAFGYRCSPEIGRFYFDWLISRSPWSTTGIIPQLDKEFMFQTGFIWIDLDKVSANLLHNFLVASRAAAEWPVYITDWYQLIHDYGIHEDLAFFMLTVFTDPEQGVGGYRSFLSKKIVTFSLMDKYDWPLDTYRCDEEYLRNFLSHKTPGKSTRMFYPSASTAPVNTLWGRVDKKSYISELQNRYKDVMTLKVIKSTYSNISAWVIELEDVIRIIKEEEFRLGLKQERVAA